MTHCPTTLGLLTAATITLLLGCDSPLAEVDEPPVVATMEEASLEEQIVGLWEKEFQSSTIGWLFKEGGVFQAGEARPFFPVVGTWSLEGDTLELFDPGCVDRGFYQIEIEDQDLTARLIDESCDGRAKTLAGTWHRFVYGE